MFPFRKRIPTLTLEQQLASLADCGITLNSEATPDDLLSHYSREQYEAVPYKELIPILGLELEREPFAPLSDRLWMCDYERIEDHGAYADVIDRLDRMSESSLHISDVTDHVDIDEGTAWVEFHKSGSRIHWDAKVHNDWLDPNIVVKFDKLLKDDPAGFRIYSNHRDFGQSAYFACLRPTEFQHFQKLVTFKLREIERQA
jgi:hypothetical protein